MSTPQAPASDIVTVPGREALDRSGVERHDPDLLARLRADPRSRVLVVRADAARLADDTSLRLDYVRPDDVPGDARWAFLGRDSSARAVLLAALPAGSPTDDESRDGWVGLRAVGGDLDAQDAATLTAGVSLGRWLWDAAFCPACGGRTDLRQSGWARRCRRCGREHFPRTDPAMIVAVEDAAGEHLLLGSNVMWGQDRYSCFAGFVEAGESAEEAVARELHEEAGVDVVTTRYRGSQAWPYPRSLMLGFRATVAAAPVARADGEEIAAVRWFTRAQIARVLAQGDWNAPGEGVRLPGTASIARRLIIDWLDRA